MVNRACQLKTSSNTLKQCLRKLYNGTCEVTIIFFQKSSRIFAIESNFFGQYVILNQAITLRQIVVMFYPADQQNFFQFVFRHGIDTGLFHFNQYFSLKNWFRHYKKKNGLSIRQKNFFINVRHISRSQKIIQNAKKQPDITAGMRKQRLPRLLMSPSRSLYTS